MIKRKNVNPAQAAYKALESNGLRVKKVVDRTAEDYSFVIRGDSFSVEPKTELTKNILVLNSNQKPAYKKKTIKYFLKGGKYIALTLHSVSTLLSEIHTQVGK